MQLELLSNEKNYTQLKADLSRLQDEVTIPFNVSEWVLKKQNLTSEKHAEAFWFKEKKSAQLKFYSRYFEVKSWQKRMTTFLHELSHIGLFLSEDKPSDWMEMHKFKVNSRFEKEVNERRYNCEMENCVYSICVEILTLPLEFLTEEYFKREFHDFFIFRKNAYYDLKTSWENSLEKWLQKTKWSGLEYVAPYAVYGDFLKIKHFIKIIENDDEENLSRFNTLYHKRKSTLKNLCDEELLNYFNKNEDRFTNVELSPLYFNENHFLELADRLWLLPRTY